MWCVGEKTESVDCPFAYVLVIRNSKCKGKEKALEKDKRVYEKAKPLGEIRLKKHRHLERSREIP